MIKSIFIILATLLFGCSKMQVNDFSRVKPEFDFYKFFEGQTIGQGLFYDRFGRVKSRFKVELSGSVENDQTLILNEVLTYTDTNEVNTREFRISKEQGGYRVSCPDLVSDGSITESGNAVRWSYVLKQPIDGKTYNLKFDDWMFRMDEQTVINRAYAYWYGIFVGEVFMTVNKLK